MDNGFNKKMLKYSLILTLINCITAIIFDIQECPEHLVIPYVSLTALTFISSGFLLYKNEKNGYRESYVTTLFLFLGSWGVLSQFVYPQGYLTVILSFFGLSLFSGISFKKIFFLITPFVCFIIAAIMFSNMKNLTEDFEKITKQNYVYSVLIFSSLILISYYLKNKILEKVKILESKMFDLGSKSSIFIHDLKNLVGPLVNDSKLVLRKTEPEDIQRINTNLSNNIVHLKEFILEFNQSFSFKEEKVNVDIKEIFSSIKKMYSKKMEDITFDISQVDNFMGDPKAFKSILSNMIINSSDAFVSNKIENKKVSIVFKNKKLTYLDNAGGIPAEKIKAILEDSFFTSKEQGSGIGIYTIKKYSSLMGGRAHFENKGKGLQITIDFDK